MSGAERVNTQWLFPCLLISFCAIYLIYYPPSYGIEDEGNILQLSYSLSHGTIFPRSCRAIRRTLNRWPSRFEVLDFSRSDDRAAVEARLAARVWTGSVILRGWCFRRAQLAQAGRPQRRLERAVFSFIRIALLHAERDGCRACRRRRTVRDISSAARTAATDAGRPDVRRERPDAPVDGSVRDSERHRLAA